MIGPLLFVIGFVIFVPWLIVVLSKRDNGLEGLMYMISTIWAPLMSAGAVVWMCGK